MRSPELPQLQLLLLTIAVKTRCHEQRAPGRSSSSSRRQQQQHLSLDVSRHRYLLEMLQEFGLSNPQAAVAPWSEAVAEAVMPTCYTKLFTTSVQQFRCSSTVMQQYLSNPAPEHMVGWLGTVEQWEQASDPQFKEHFARYSEVLRAAQPGALMLLEAAHNLHQIDTEFAASAAAAALACTLSVMLRSATMRDSSSSIGDGEGDNGNESTGPADVTAAAAAVAAGEGAASAGGRVSVQRESHMQPDAAFNVAHLVKLVSGECAVMVCRWIVQLCMHVHN
jgi:hypothetical protein